MKQKYIDVDIVIINGKEKRKFSFTTTEDIIDEFKTAFAKQDIYEMEWGDDESPASLALNMRRVFELRVNRTETVTTITVIK